MSYVPAHLHTVYSTLDACNKINELTDKLVEYGITHCAITDHGTMAGILEFYKSCTKKKITPLIGCEAYITLDPDGLDKPDMTKDNGHLVLIAKNNEGYKALSVLCSESYIQNFYYKPRIFIEKLLQYKGLLVGTTACLGSVLSKLGSPVFDDEKKVWNDPYGCTAATLEMLIECFDPGDLYLEVQDWDDGTGRQPAWNDFMKIFAEEYNLPLMLGVDSHYLNKEDAELHKMMMAMQFGKTLQDYLAEGKMIYPPEFYLKSPDEYIASCNKLGIQNTSLELINKCSGVSLDLTEYYLPVFKLEEADDYNEFLGEYNAKNNKNNKTTA